MSGTEKEGSMSNYEDGRDDPGRDPRGGAATYSPGPMYPSAPPVPYGYHLRPRRVYPIETKPFYLTSEFIGAVLAIAGIAITAASSEAFGAWRAWILITAVTVGYMVSRGIAKSGTRSHADDPREHWGRGNDGQQDGR
jgi:hypothetical protein